MKNSWSVLLFLLWLPGVAQGNEIHSQVQPASTSVPHGASMPMNPHVSGKPAPGTRATRSTVTINEKQAETITLTLAEISFQRVEKWIRTAGQADPGTKRVSGRVYGEEAGLIKIGQATRVFPLVGREPVLQGKVIKVSTGNGAALVETDVEDKWYGDAKYYIMEIIINYGRFLAIPNEAIIEDAGRKIVYVAEKDNRYSPREIVTGHRGELFTQIIHPLKAGELVVTFGSFFIDAEYKLNANGERSKDRKGGHFAPRHH